MQNFLTQAKRIVIFILLLAVIPLGFVNGYFALLKHTAVFSENIALLNESGAYYKVCYNAAIISFIVTYFSAVAINRNNHLPRWLKVLLLPSLYIILFFAWLFVLTY